MEEAPKDGTDILFKLADSWDVGCWVSHMPVPGWFADDHCGGGARVKPMGWLPLPRRLSE